MVYRLAVLIGLLAGTVAGCLAVAAAMQHNPQGIYVDNEAGNFNYSVLAAIFASWVAVLGVCTADTILVVAFLVGRASAIFRASRRTR